MITIFILIVISVFAISMHSGIIQKNIDAKSSGRTLIPVILQIINAISLACLGWLYIELVYSGIYLSIKEYFLTGILWYFLTFCAVHYPIISLFKEQQLDILLPGKYTISIKKKYTRVIIESVKVLIWFIYTAWILFYLEI